MSAPQKEGPALNGLQAILDQIQQDAQTQAEEVLAAARADAHATLESARQEAERRSQAILESAQEEAVRIRQQGESAAQMEKRDQVLRCKQRLIRELLEQVCTALEAAPEKEYFDTILRLAGQYVRPGHCVMFLNEHDLNRLPADFEKRLQNVSPLWTITLSQEARPLESGFLLVYGQVDVNCSFRALMEERLDLLRDEAGKMLFTPV